MKDLGKELIELRLIKGLTLKQVSELTRINIKYLENLENNKFNFLPEIYVRSFLKSYVRAIDGDEKYIFQLFDEITKHKNEDITENKSEIEKNIPQKEKEEKKDFFSFYKTLNAKNIKIILGLIFLITLMLIIIYNTKNEIRETEKIRSKKSDTIETIKRENLSEDFNNIVISDSLLLGITSSDSVWIRVKMDNIKVSEVYMLKNENKYFKAKDKFELLIGNAGAISLKMNGKELPFEGMKGSVKKIEIDRTGIKLIN